MSGIAKMEKLKVVGSKPPDMLSTMNVNLDKQKKMDVGEVGDKVHFKGHGKITGIHHDNYGHSMHVEIHKIEPHTEDQEM